MPVQLPAPLMGRAQPQPAPAAREYDFLIKTVIVGDSGVGKSSLLKQFVDGVFVEGFLSTIGVDFAIRTMDIEGRVAKMQIWDTAGQERFANIVSTYYRGAHGVMIVVDVTNPQSVRGVDKWVQQLRQFAPATCRAVLVANKGDMSNHRCVSHRELLDIADRLGIPLIEVSAKNSDGVKSAFQTLGASVVESFGEQYRNAGGVELAPGGAVPLRDTHDASERSCCGLM